MKFDGNTTTISQLKEHTASVIKKVRGNSQPIIITQGGSARAVMLSVEEYNKQRNTMLLLKIMAIGEKEIKYGQVLDHDKVFSRLKKRLNSPQ